MNAVSLTEVKMKGGERESGSESESGEDEAMKVEKKKKCKKVNNEKYIEGKGCLLGMARSNWRVGMGIRKDQEGYGWWALFETTNER